MKKCPSHLSSEARDWWKRICNDYELDDAGLLLLSSALEAFDRMRQSQAILKTEGITIADRFDQPKPHPAFAVERDSRAAMISALRALHLDIEPLNDRPGRPPGA